MNGYILISRTIVESEIWSKPPLYLKVWIWLLCKAQYQDYRGLKRGQLLTSLKEIQDGCFHYVGYRKETPTRNQIWKILDWMKSCDSEFTKERRKNDESNMIETTKETDGILITICNFNDYQEPKFYERNNEETAKDTRKQHDRNATSLKKKEKKENNNNIYSALGEFQNVSLSEEELEKLKQRFPYDWQERIENLSAYMKSKGRRYKSHYATILNWARKESKDASKPANNQSEENAGSPAGAGDEYEKFFK